jgi:hypothetical protein
VANGVGWGRDGRALGHERGLTRSASDTRLAEFDLVVIGGTTRSIGHERRRWAAEGPGTDGRGEGPGWREVLYELRYMVNRKVRVGPGGTFPVNTQAKRGKGYTSGWVGTFLCTCEDDLLRLDPTTQPYPLFRLPCLFLWKVAKSLYK